MIFANSLPMRLLQDAWGDLEHAVERVVGFTALAIEVLAVVVIAVFTIGATYSFVRRLGAHRGGGPAFDEYKVRLGRGLLLGLEILVAADIVRTVVLELNLANVVILGILILIRTFLSWSLVLEIEHRWPWQPRAAAATVAEPVGSAAEAPRD